MALGRLVAPITTTYQAAVTKHTRPNRDIDSKIVACVQEFELANILPETEHDVRIPTYAFSSYSII